MTRTARPRRRSATAVAAATLALVAGCSGDPVGQSPADRDPAAAVATADPDDPACRRAPDEQLKLDLGVQAAGAKPGGGALSRREVRDLLDAAEDAGADVISTTASWATQQPYRGAPYDWDEMDMVVRGARQRGLEVRLALHTMPQWAQDAPRSDTTWRAPRSAPELRRWSRFVTDLLDHLGNRIDYLEVWTDPNATERWRTGPDPLEFATLLDVTWRTVDRAAPEVTVVSGGLSGNALGYLQEVYAAREALGGPTLWDQLGLHPSATGQHPGEGPDPSSEEPFGLYDRTFIGYRLVRDLMDEQGDGEVPIYLSRVGYRTDGPEGVSDERRAEYAVAALDLAACDPTVSALSWYYLHPTPFDPDAFTILDGDGTRSATFRAIRSWSRERSSRR